MTTWYDYMVRASEHAGSDGDLWFRYLYKVIKDEETKLTTDDVEQLLKNPTLTPFQKITLQDALTEGTHTREHVLQANRKSQPGDIIKLIKIRSIKDVTNKLKEYGFQPDLSLILEVFEIAYGMEWLAEYMTEHSDELR